MNIHHNLLQIKTVGQGENEFVIAAFSIINVIYNDMPILLLPRDRWGN